MKIYSPSKSNRNQRYTHINNKREKCLANNCSYAIKHIGFNETNHALDHNLRKMFSPQARHSCYFRKNFPDESAHIIAILSRAKVNAITLLQASAELVLRLAAHQQNTLFRIIKS